MADVPSDPDDEAVIGQKVLEMADQLKVAHAVCPGAVASWGFHVDGVRYALQMRVAPAEPAG
ncbi:MAG: hypothetical protein U9R07_11735 [Pseudomonadota bacterium]|nr:hypothetical protein [Pseudomonadota bacterium]